MDFLKNESLTQTIIKCPYVSASKPIVNRVLLDSFWEGGGVLIFLKKS